MGVGEIDRFLERWQMGVKDLGREMILARTSRDRERWSCCSTAGPRLDGSGHGGGARVRPAHYGRSAFGEGGPGALMFGQTDGPPPLTRRSRG